MVFRVAKRAAGSVLQALMAQNEGKFSPEAAIVWSAILPHHKVKVLENVFCVKCGVTEMVKFSGEMKKGDLILTGSCAKCGGRVVRLIESSERDPHRN